MDRTEELEEQVRRLTETVDEMRTRMTTLEGRGSVPDPSPKRSDRRGFLRLGAGAALGALGWVAAKAVPASAATGDPMVLGTAMSANASTTVSGAAAGTPVKVLAAADATFDQTALTAAGGFAGTLQGLGTSGSVEGVDGWASGPLAYGVYGLSDSGYGVVGESNTGVSVYARRGGRIRQAARAGAGNPGFPPSLYEQVRDANGVLWIHNAAGEWRRVNTVRVDAANGLGGVFAPFRLLDTRGGAKKRAGSVTVVSIAGTGGTGASAVPADAIAAVGNLTATQYNGGGYLAISPAGVSVGTSTVNFLPGQIAIANSFICGLNGGALQVYVGGAASHFIVDITGYIQ
jgi:hypothetical protein